jgi:RNA polymerase sigma-70 factor (ECF subfamily)
MTHPVSDEALLKGVIHGRQDMFEQLVKRYEGRLYGFLHRMAPPHADAADLFQETFLRVFRHASSFKGRGSFKAWVYTIAVNVCRRHGSRTLPDSLEQEPVNDASRPPEAAEAEEVRERIAQAVAALPEAQREVLVLKIYEDLSYAEIARVVNRSVGTVKSQMRYALGKLRGRLHELAVSLGVV